MSARFSPSARDLICFCFVLLFPACAGAGGGACHDRVSCGVGASGLPSCWPAGPSFASVPEPGGAPASTEGGSDRGRVAPGPRSTADRLRVRVAPLSPTTRITNTLVRAIGQQSRPIVLLGRHVMRCTAGRCRRRWRRSPRGLPRPKSRRPTEPAGGRTIHPPGSPIRRSPLIAPRGKSARASRCSLTPPIRVSSAEEPRPPEGAPPDCRLGGCPRQSEFLHPHRSAARLMVAAAARRQGPRRLRGSRRPLRRLSPLTARLVGRPKGRAFRGAAASGRSSLSALTTSDL